MKILVTVKRVIDPYIKVRVRADQSAVETDGVKMAMNPFCENALEEALRWREAGIANEVVVLSVGNDSCVETLRTALAIGADRAIHVKAANTPQPLATAKIITAVAKREDPGVIWMGKQGIDGDYNQTGQMTAALLGWGQGLFLSSAKFAEGVVTGESEVDSGIRVIQVKTPCVLTADLRLNEARYATLPNIMKAKKKPFETLTPEELSVDASDRLTTLIVNTPPPRAGGVRVADVAELVSKLREEAKVIA